MKAHSFTGDRSDRLMRAVNIARTRSHSEAPQQPMRNYLLGLFAVGLLTPDGNGLSMETVPEHPGYEYTLNLLRPVMRGVRDQLVRSRLHTAVEAESDGRTERVYKVFENLAECRRQAEIEAARRQGRDRSGQPLRQATKQQPKKGRRRGKSKSRRGFVMHRQGGLRGSFVCHH